WRRVRRRADPSSGNRRPMDRTTGEGKQPRAGLGYAIRRVELGTVFLRPRLRAYRIHRNVALDRSGTGRLRGPADQSGQSVGGEPAPCSIAAFDCGRRPGVDPGRATPQLGRKKVAGEVILGPEPQED